MSVLLESLFHHSIIRTKLNTKNGLDIKQCINIKYSSEICHSYYFSIHTNYIILLLSLIYSGHNCNQVCIYYNSHHGV